IVFVLDDAEDNDEPLITILRQLMPTEAGPSPLLIANFKRELDPATTDLETSSPTLNDPKRGWSIITHQLERLDVREMQHFLQRAIAIAPSAATWIADRADGNPNFATLILRSTLTRYGDDVLHDTIALARALSSLPYETSALLTAHIDEIWRSTQV